MPLQGYGLTVKLKRTEYIYYEKENGFANSSTSARKRWSILVKEKLNSQIAFS